MDDFNIAKDEAFGIVPILQSGDEHQFLLIQHHAGHWGFPKGHADPGETAVQAACREFEEETGITRFTLLDDASFSEQYPYTRNGKKFNKIVVYYLAFVQSVTVNCQPEEIKAYDWLSYDRAISRLTFDGAKRVLTEVQKYLA
jgi:8-oxo-dGTP pyrophosphatase MutT (NUDIX family)